jgi:hypothetical protein
MRTTLPINSDLRCVHCGNFVSAEVLLAGVKNRNHCPYCLWSRHVDLFEAGDRLSACKSPMRPVGLTFKIRHKKYASVPNGTVANGELMLIHQCVTCESLSINRVAADDFPEVILDVFQVSLRITDRTQEQIRGSGINLLNGECTHAVYRQLYGESVHA